MAEPIQMFQNFELTRTMVAAGRAISFTQEWLGILLIVTDVTGGGAADFRIQWSHDGQQWFEPNPQDRVALVTATGTFIKSIPLKACYWRIGAEVNGPGAVSFTCTGTALV